MPSRIILSTPFLKSFGYFDYDPITLEEAIVWLNRGQYFCALRSRDMCRVLHEITGKWFYPLAGAETPALTPGDEALVFFIPTTDEMPSVKGMPPEYMQEHYVLGLLKRVDGVVTDVQQGEETEMENATEPQEAFLANKGSSL